MTHSFQVYVLFLRYVYNTINMRSSVGPGHCDMYTLYALHYNDMASEYGEMVTLCSHHLVIFDCLILASLRLVGTHCSLHSLFLE